MNVNPKREGFVEDEAVHARPQVIEGEKAAPSRPQRAVPPPEIEPSPAEQVPTPDAEEWPIVVVLGKPIRDAAGGGQIKEISMREPRAGDINRYGNPVRFNAEGDPVIDERKMTYMIAALSGILPPFIEQLSTRDWNTCAYKLRRFFLPDPAAW